MPIIAWYMTLENNRGFCSPLLLRPLSNLGRSTGFPSPNGTAMLPRMTDFTVLATNALWVTDGHYCRINRPETPPSLSTIRGRAPTNSDRTITSTSDEHHRSALKRMVKETLTAVFKGGYSYKGVDYQSLTVVTVVIAKSKSIGALVAGTASSGTVSSGTRWHGSTILILVSHGSLHQIIQIEEHWCQWQEQWGQEHRVTC